MQDPRTPNTRNINTRGGNYNEEIKGNYIQGNFFQNIWNVTFGQTITPIGNLARPENQRKLLASVKQEVIGRLDQSLHNAVVIELGKQSQPKRVKRSWDAEVKIGLKPTRPLPYKTTITEVFNSDEIAGKLLILGEPGSGKTTMLLNLAKDLIEHAVEDPNYSVPVLFNLSSWKNNHQFINDWLIAELRSKYGVSKKFGEQLVKNHQILPLLDGLDEIKLQHQELCVLAINKFLTGEPRPSYLVVCSRNEEYNNYPTKLQLNGAIYLQPLTNTQIYNYLTDIQHKELWSIISKDSELLELLKVPLLLNILILVSQDISNKELYSLSSTTDFIQYLLNAYIKLMLNRSFDSKLYLKKTPNTRETLMWLVYLAQQMERESKTEFLIEEIQADWLSKTEIDNYKSMVQMFLCIFYGLVCGLKYWLFLAALTTSEEMHGFICLIVFAVLFLILIEKLPFTLIWDLGYFTIIFFIIPLITKDLILRLVLYSKGYIPWNYARFLNYCTECLLLERVGNRYRFTHKIFQDHFAQMKFERPN